MREFTFRGWMKKETRMTKPEVVGEYGWYETSADFEDGIKCRQPFETLMQYTGLRDLKGNEIYEGDILIDSGKYTWAVSWSDDHACFMVTSLENNSVVAEIIDNLNMTVIGNIYEGQFNNQQ